MSNGSDGGGFFSSFGRFFRNLFGGGGASDSSGNGGVSGNGGAGRSALDGGNGGNGGDGGHGGGGGDPQPPPAVSGAGGLTALQKSTIQAIVNIFETGSAIGDYSKVTLLPGDPGHLTYGRSQTTLGSGNLHRLIQDYVTRPDAQFGPELEPFLPELAARDVALDDNATFKGLLRQAGDDPVMREVQDEFFDRVYWQPAESAAVALGVETPLGYAVVYDSHIHGSWGRLRDRTTERHGALSEIGEEAWISHYVAERRHWLATHSITILHNTVYRMDAFRTLIDDGNRSLTLPLTVRGVTLSEGLLTGTGPAPSRFGNRLLKVGQPPLRGNDVRAVQEALRDLGHDVDVTGSYDAATKAAVMAFQRARELTADGIVGPATRSALSGALAEA